MNYSSGLVLPAWVSSSLDVDMQQRKSVSQNPPSGGVSVGLLPRNAAERAGDGLADAGEGEGEEGGGELSGCEHSRLRLRPRGR